VLTIQIGSAGTGGTGGTGGRIGNLTPGSQAANGAVGTANGSVVISWTGSER
jgi:hypothetical protein